MDDLREVEGREWAEQYPRFHAAMERLAGAGYPMMAGLIRAHFDNADRFGIARDWLRGFLAGLEAEVARVAPDDEFVRQQGAGKR